MASQSPPLGTKMWNNTGEALVVWGLLAVLVLVAYRRLVWPGKGTETYSLPPGPWGWPIIGHAHLLANLPHQALRDLSTKYGPMLGLRLGQQRAVVVSSPELAKEVLLTHDKVFANRPPFQFTSSLLYKDDILFGNYGPHWRKQRRTCTVELFTAKRLQDLAYVRQEELATLLQRIADKSEGGTRAVDIGKCVGQMSSCLVMRLLHSEAASEVEGENLHNLIGELEQQGSPTIGDLIPSLSWLDFRRKRSMRTIQARVDKILTAMLVERKQNSARYDDLLQALLSKEDDRQSNVSDADALTLHAIKGIILDMMAAGIHTTALTIQWTMAELLKNPHCLRRLQEEVHSVITGAGAGGGRKRLITDADVAKMSYLKCTVKEVFRLHPVVPLLIPRFSLEECTVNGYLLPANTLVYVNVWAIGRDERVWPNAAQFTPERFQGKDTDLKGLHYKLLPFGSGRRVCLGLPLGLSVVEVTLANIVNRFDWELPSGETPASLNMDEKTGITGNKATPVLAVPKPRDI